VRALLEWVSPLAPRGPLVVVVDDTLARKKGKNIWGAKLHHDPLGWLPKAVAFGHDGVVLAIVIRVPPKDAAETTRFSARPRT
jgi:hypothetical protein